MRVLYSSPLFPPYVDELENCAAQLVPALRHTNVYRRRSTDDARWGRELRRHITLPQRAESEVSEFLD